MGRIVLRGHRVTVSAETVSAWTREALLPPLTQVGDGLLFVVSKWILRSGSIAVDDDRLTLIHSDAGGNVYVGLAATLDPITVTYTGFPVASNESQAVAVTWRNRLNGEAPTIRTFSSGEPVRVPAHTGTGAGAIAVLIGEQQGDAAGWDGATGYTTIVQVGVDAFVGIADRPDASPPEAYTSWGIGGPDESISKGMSALVLNIQPLTLVAPPCRNFPRDDRQALSGARNYPPPKSRQGSSRGVGYY